MKGIHIFCVCFQRQAKDFLRYPNYFLKCFFYTPISSVLPFYFLIKSCAQNVEKETIFYLLVCVILWKYIEFSLVETCNISNRELNIGTVEVLFSLPFDKKHWILGNALTPNCLFMVSNGLCIGASMAALGINISAIKWHMWLAFLCLSLQVAVFSVLVFMLNIRFKKMFHTLLLFLDVAYLLSGVTYPVEQLPMGLGALGKALPFTWVFQLMRGEAAAPGEIAFYLAVNGAYMLLVWKIYKKILKDIKRDGQLSNY